MNLLFLLFEVMGEFPTVAFLWGFFLIVGVGGFLLTRFHPAFLLPILLIVFFFSAGQIFEIHSDLHPQIIREAGYGYLAHFYAAIPVGSTVLPCLGIVVWFKRRQEK